MSMTNEEMLAELAKLKAENEALKASQTRGTSLKVGESGAVSVYGLQRFPVSLHADQWAKVFAMREQIEAFIVANAEEIATKSDQRKAAKEAEKAAAKLAASGGVKPSDFKTITGPDGKPMTVRAA